MYSTPRPGPPGLPGQPVYVPPAPVRRYPGLRFVASTCIFSAWATLILSILGGILMMAGGGLSAAGAALGSTGGTDPMSGGSAGTGTPSNPLGPILLMMLSGIKIATGLFTIASGIGGFIIFLALGLLIYLLLDMEENTRTAAQAMSAIARRMGMQG